MKKVKTAFIFDPAPGIFKDISHEVRVARGEIDAICGFEDDRHFPLKIAYKEETITEEMMSKNFDLFILDYGGMAYSGASGMVEFMVETVCKYARDHPGCLVVIWTEYTAEFYQDELEKEFGHLDNLICRYGNSFEIHENRYGSDEFIKKFRSWFSHEIKNPEIVEIPQIH